MKRSIKTEKASGFVPGAFTVHSQQQVALIMKVIRIYS